MKLKSEIFLYILLVISSCSTDRTEKDLYKNNSYVHLFFETEEECIASQPEPDFFYNCYQQLDFLDDKKVQILLSDILWTGEYRLEKDKLVLTFTPNNEIPNGQIIFEILNNSKLLKLDDQSIWKKINGNSIYD